MPNLLFLMTDQMQGRVLDPDSPCRTPNFDRLAARGVRFQRAYTPNPVCSPARASLMTGRLPHNHGVLQVVHCVDDDQSVLRTQHPHWAQRLEAAGYRTGYFGKWHVERSNDLSRFGWQTQAEVQGKMVPEEAGYSLEKFTEMPGYRRSRFYGVTDAPMAERGLGRRVAAGLDFLDEATQQNNPWCCFVSVLEPHDPFICGEEAFAQYDVDALPLPASLHDDLAGRPNLYRKAARVFADWTEREHREAAACYYASVTEIDQQFARLIERVEQAGQLDNTIIVLTSDHGELLGAHGLYCKNVHAGEEIYNIPLVMAGPGIVENATTEARVGLHDLAQTLLDLESCNPIDTPDSRSFASVLHDPAAHEADFRTGYAEYEGTRYQFTQRVLWQDNWKFVHNGFDFDELYNLADDPHEMHNLVDEPAHAERLHALTQQMWQIIERTGDHSLLNAHYPPLRLAPAGPM